MQATSQRRDLLLLSRRAIPKIVVTVGALAIVAVRLRWPSLGIDLVAVALLVFAAIPWLGGIFKSLPTPWGQLEWQQKVEDDLKAAKDTAESARRVAAV